MAGRYLATELQDENGDVIYPHTEADIVFASDGTTVEENLGGDVTDTEMQEIFSNSDIQFETGKKLSVKEKIKRTLKRYQTLLGMRILDTVEEVEANTDDGYLMGAKAGAALINDLGGYSFGETADGKPGYRKPGADSVTPFSNIVDYLPTRIVLTSGNVDYAAITCGDFVKYYRSGYDYFCCVNVKCVASVRVKTDANASLSDAYVYGAATIDATGGTQLMYIPPSTENNRNRDAILNLDNYDFLLFKCLPTYSAQSGHATRFTLTWA